LFYPAGYAGVVGVASVDPFLEQSFFSNFNARVKYAAPGELVLSLLPAPAPSTVWPTTIPTVLQNVRLQATVPSKRTVTLPNGTQTTVPTYQQYTWPWLYLQLADGPVRNVPRRALVDCARGTGRDCPNARRRVCLVEWGTMNSCPQLVDCFTRGGVAALLYTTKVGATQYGDCQPFPVILQGSCGLTSATLQPTLTISRLDGLALQQAVTEAAAMKLNAWATLRAALPTANSFKAMPSMAYLQVRVGRL